MKKEEIVLELKKMNAEEILKLYNSVIQHLKYLEDNIIQLESEGSNDE